MKVSVSQVYTSIGCNRTPEIVDWNDDGIICFGAKNALVIYDTNIKGKDPLTVFSHHRSQVNSVKWLRKSDGSSNELISGSADKTAAIWTLDEGDWKVTSSLTGHGDGVTCIHGVYNGDTLVVYTGSIDCTIRVWERKDGTTSLKQTISLHNGLCLSLHSHILPTVSQPVLFAALDDHKIHVFAGEEYHRVHTLIGHEDWVRGLDVVNVDESTILLASASQDTYIRIWRIQCHTDQPSSDIKVEEKVFPAYGQQWSVKLDAVLAGHEGWVYGVQWQQPEPGGQLSYRLLSSSLDKTLIIWEPEGQAGVWTERARLGEVGGNGLGFYGGRLGPKGTSVLGNGYNGSLHLWRKCEKTSRWIRAVVSGGHFGPVEDVRWEPQGRYLLSTSADQTTRVHAPWRTGDVEEWHEISRPQVHGYDLYSLASVSPSTFAAAAEEKVIRVFAATHNFIQNFASITRDEIQNGGGGPEGATVPSLGLSNKAVFADDDQQDGDDDNDGYFVPVTLTEPPTEEVLMQNTLWPETHKLYGHGYEVFSLAAAPDATLLASACKATAQEHAHIILWETSTWQQIQKLPSHSLTITQMEFSPDSQHLLSVSRDRKWTLFRRRQGSNRFDLAAGTDKGNQVHTRIIWCCAWAHDGEVFGTGSRNGKVCVWSKTNTITETSLKDYAQNGDTLNAKESVTALAFAPILREASRLVAVGLETGVVRLYAFDGVWKVLFEMDKSLAHHLTVKRLTFKQRSEELLLASCGADHLVRIYRISVT